MIFKCSQSWGWFKTTLFCHSLRDADGDGDQCPMWTFPTVRPSSMSQLQMDYTHSESEVRAAQSLRRVPCAVSSSPLFSCLQSGDSMKRQPKSQCLSALVTPIFREVSGMLLRLLLKLCQSELRKCSSCPAEGQAASERRGSRSHRGAGERLQPGRGVVSGHL